MSEKRTNNPDGTYTITYPSGRKIVYEKDGTPCRACNTLLDFQAANMMKKQGGSFPSFDKKPAASVALAGSVGASTGAYAKDCPADVEQLGNGTWTLLHSIAAKYPTSPTAEQQNDLKSFISTLSKLYPCWFCAGDFRQYIKKNEIQVKDQDSFGKWLCNAHNEVNVKLGKPKFNCNLWKQRWKDGWEDGKCD